MIWEHKRKGSWRATASPGWNALPNLFVSKRVRDSAAANCSLDESQPCRIAHDTHKQNIRSSKNVTNKILLVRNICKLYLHHEKKKETTCLQNGTFYIRANKMFHLTQSLFFPTFWLTKKISRIWISSWPKAIFCLLICLFEFASESKNQLFTLFYLECTYPKCAINNLLD